MKQKKVFLFFLVVVIVIVSGVFLFRGSQPKEETPPPVKVKKEIPLALRPFVSLTPTSDAHNLSLKVTMPDMAESFDYTLVYMAEGVQQGVSGTDVTPSSDTREVIRELLLGSCSKGVCKYDSNVEEGELTLEVEYEKDLGEFVVPFMMFQPKTEKLTAVDGNFFFALNEPTSGYTIVMDTVGFPGKVSPNPLSKIYGVFSSSKKEIEGTVSFFVTGLSDKSTVVSFIEGNLKQLDSDIDTDTGKIEASAVFPGVFLVINK